ncbi:hypothetical protein AB0K60_04760 [Thermopolyspora sp. NPDC052614]|uniref:hypothetical protein n=1 Tax=Thermopolyspora sp. NPDC052614 TaxID=3155682 RepID=UPI00342AD68F
MMFNAFGIPIRTALRPGSEQVLYRESEPLCPWRFHGHELLYADVDDTAAAFQHFVEDGPGVIDILEKGHLVVVNGVEGSGKTTLIHRCVDHMRDKLAEWRSQSGQDATPAPGGLWSIKPRVPGISVVDLSRESRKVAYDDNGRLCPLSAINQAIFKKVARSVQSDMEPHDERIQNMLDRHGSKLTDMYEEFAEVLRDRNSFALIILPFIPLGSERVHRDYLRAHLTFSAPRIVFFAETVGTGLKDMMEVAPSDQDRQLVTHLSIGKLKNGDCDRFIGARTGHAHQRPDHVRVAPAVIANASKDIENRTVRWLQIVFYSLSKAAIGDNRDEIGPDDYQRFEKQRRDGLRRRPLRRGRDRDSEP